MCKYHGFAWPHCVEHEHQDYTPHRIHHRTVVFVQVRQHIPFVPSPRNYNGSAIACGSSHMCETIKDRVTDVGKTQLCWKQWLRAWCVCAPGIHTVCLLSNVIPPLVHLLHLYACHTHGVHLGACALGARRALGVLARLKHMQCLWEVGTLSSIVQPV